MRFFFSKQDMSIFLIIQTGTGTQTKKTRTTLNKLNTKLDLKIGHDMGNKIGHEIGGEIGHLMTCPSHEMFDFKFLKKKKIYSKNPGLWLTASGARRHRGSSTCRAPETKLAG